MDELDKWISDVLEGRISTEADDGDYDLTDEDDEDSDEDAEDDDGKFAKAYKLSYNNVCGISNSNYYFRISDRYVVTECTNSDIQRYYFFHTV